MAKIYDVAVVGAGLAGLTTAYKLQQKGRSVIVLEAKARPGGRLMNQSIAGSIVDAGGSWVGPQQTALLALLDELGIATWPQHLTGHHVFMWDGKRKTFKGEVPPLQLPALVDVQVALWRLNRLAKQFVGIEPWRHPQAEALDTTTLGAWISQHVHTRGARFFMDVITAPSFGCRPSELSLLAFLVHIASAGNIETLVGTRGAALDRHIAGGTGGMCQALAQTLGDALWLEASVAAVDQTGEAAVLATPRGDIQAEQVVIAIDPVTAGRIRHLPQLPQQRQALERTYTLGSGIKAHVAYSTPFWRSIHLSGESIANTGLVPVTFDVTPPEVGVGILTCFMGEPISDTVALLQPNALAERKAQVLTELVERFGPQAAHPIDYIEQDWALEPYQSGCLPCPGPGVLTTARDAWTKPAGRLHFAGAESSPLWEGHMDGAVRSAERVVQEICGIPKDSKA